VNLDKFLSSGLAAQTAVDELGHGATAGDPTTEQGTEIKRAIASRLVSDDIHEALTVATEAILVAMKQKDRFDTMRPLERQLLAESVEGLGKCCYTLGAAVRGKEIK